MVSRAPRCSRLILPSKAAGFARKIASIILCRSDSDRSPMRHAMPRSVAFAPTLIWVVLRTVRSVLVGLTRSDGTTDCAADGWTEVGTTCADGATDDATGATDGSTICACGALTSVAARGEAKPGGSSSNVY